MRSEWGVTGALASIYAVRMLGLFMILPVFALYARGLDGTTPAKVGLAIGAYGLTQALLQIPFGVLSDRFGRKPIIALGLVLFAAGSVIAAVATSIDGVIAGRALQGSGAIAAALMALVADLTPEERRLRAMAAIGLSIGVSFSVAMVAGPLLDRAIGVRGIFWLTAALAGVALAVLLGLVPRPPRPIHHAEAEADPARLGAVARDTRLLRVDVGIFVLHMLLTSSFVVVPLLLADVAGVAAQHHWLVYLPVMALGFVLMVPFVVIAEKTRRFRPFLVGAAGLLLAAEASLARWHGALFPIVLALVVFFTAFNFLEAALPSLIAKLAPAPVRGTAMGVYSTSQFLGAFAGGALGGWVHGAYGETGVFALGAVAAGVWLAAAAGLEAPAAA